jgi:uncharacterized protein (TIGR00369 family)
MAKVSPSHAELRKLMEGMPFNKLVGIRLVRVHKDGVTIACKLRPDLLNAAGVLHGGVTATVADTAMGIAVTMQLGRIAATTVEMKLNYLRPVASGTVTARARILRMGSTLCIGRVDLFNDSKEQVGAALVTYMLLKPPS